MAEHSSAEVGAESSTGPLCHGSTQAVCAGLPTTRAARASCPVCSRLMPVTKAGTLMIHGPLGNRCAGSGM